MSILRLASVIRAVTVFRSGAMVTRSAVITPGEHGGPSAVQLDGLPLLMDDDSVQVELHPVEDGPTPVAGELRVTLAVPPSDHQHQAPTEAELREASIALAKARQAYADLKAIQETVTSLVPGPRGASPPGAAPLAPPTEARLCLLTLRREQLDRLQTELRTASQRLHRAQEHWDTLQERARREPTDEQRRPFEARKAVVVNLQPVSTTSSATIELHLRYFVRGARWAPGYVLRLDPSLERGTLELRAVVGQATGERWPDVALTLSTAHPQTWTDLPELASLRVGRCQAPNDTIGWRPPPVGTERLYTDYDRLERPQPPPAKHYKSAAAGAPGRAASLPRTQPAQDAKPEATTQTSRMMAGTAPLARGRHGGRHRGPPASAGATAAPSAEAASAVLSTSDTAGFTPRGMAGGEHSGPTTLTATRAALDYAHMRMPSADDPHRGRLKRAEGDASTSTPRPPATARANRLERRAAPSGYQWVNTTDGFDYAYVAQARVSVDGDGELRGLMLRSTPVEPRCRYICVPRQVTDVFGVLVVQNPIDAPLLTGPVDVYADGRFLLRSTLEQAPPRGRLTLGLGVDPSIKVARNMRFADESSGLLKRHRELEHRVEIEVHNHRAQPIELEVREQVPIPPSERNDVEITIGRVDPPWDVWEQDDPPLEGGRAWRVKVAPGATRTLTAQWSIRIPQHHELVGGNRREG